MSQILTPTVPPSGLPPDDADPFRLGWRHVRVTRPDGTEVVELVPLTHEDLLYPEEEDFVVNRPRHTLDLFYCFGALNAFFDGVAGMVILGDCRIDFGVLGIRPLGPDILVLDGVREWLKKGTFHIAEEGGRPVLALEIAAPETRGHDLHAKPDLYYRAGVQKYVIIDRGWDAEHPAKLLGNQRGPDGWVPLPADAQGRLDLSPLPLRLGLEDDRPWLYDARTGARLPDMPEALRERNAALAGLAEESRARADAEARARDAEARAQDETARRVALEERLRLLEEQLRQQGSP